MSIGIKSYVMQYFFFPIFFQNFLSPKAKIFVREILKGMLKLGSLFVSEDSELIQAIIFFDISDEIFDFGSLWGPYHKSIQ